MTVTVNGTTGVSLIQDGTVTSAKIVDGSVTPADTQVGALPSMVWLHTSNGYGSTSTMIKRFTTTVVSQGADITYADSATLGASFTINANGIYAMSTTGQVAASIQAGFSVNTTTPATAILSIAAAERIVVGSGVASSGASCAATLYLAAGAVVRVHNNGAATSNAAVESVIITRVA